MVDLGWLQKLDHANMPNVDANLLQPADPDWDPKRDYSVPWQSGFTGIAYNAKYTGEVRSFEELLTNPELKGKISLLSEMRDTMGVPAQGRRRPGKFTDDEWTRRSRLEDVVASGQIRRFTGNDYVDDLNKGDIVACEAWSGDVIAMQYDNPDIKWVVPEEGALLVVGQHAGAEQGRPQGQRRGADELLLRPGGRGRRWRPGSTTSARSRARGRRWRRIDPEPGRRPADLPRRRRPGRRRSPSCPSTRPRPRSTTTDFSQRSG